MEASTARTSADSAADAIVRALAEAGARLMFGVPGGGPNLDVVGAAATAGLRFVLAHGETAAVIMAATYADLTGTPGAVVVTRGPGLASAVNGIAHAALDRLPVVVIADTVAASDASRVSHQRIDQAALGRSVAKAAITVGRHPGEVAARIVRMALAAPPGPVIANMDDSAPEDSAPEDSAPEDSDPPAPRPRALHSWPGPCGRRGGRCCCWARAPSRGPPPSGRPWRAAASRRCTPTGLAASSRTPPPRRPDWSPGARWSGRCWPRPISSSGSAWTRPR